MQLIQYVNPENKNKAFYIDTDTGEVYTHIRMLARLCGVTQVAIQNRLTAQNEGGNLLEVESSEILTYSDVKGGNLLEVETEGGGQEVKLITEEEVSSTIEY